MLRLEPAPELKQLRGTHQGVMDLSILPTSLIQLEGVRGDCLEIKAELVPGEAAEALLTCRTYGARHRTVWCLTAAFVHDLTPSEYMLLLRTMMSSLACSKYSIF
jgi:hypothetical protein